MLRAGSALTFAPKATRLAGVRVFAATCSLLAVLVVLAGAQAKASADDVAATHAYLQAAAALGRSAVAGIPAVQARAEALNGEVARGCPRAGAGSGEDEATQPMAHDVTSDLWAIAYGHNARAIEAFSRAVAHLRWSDARVTRLVAAEARGLRVLAGLHKRDLCADVRAWAVSGFTVTPAGVQAFDERAEGVRFEEPLGLMARYEDGADRALAARVQAYNTKVEEQEFNLGQKDWYEILETLGMNP